MLLAVDAGNSDTVTGLFEGDRLVAHERVPTDANDARTVIALIADRAAPAATVVSTTGAGLDDDYQAAVRELLGHEPLVLRADPVGPDRLANCAAAHALVGGSCIVADLGTATTVDAVGVDGALLGGAIAAGLDISMHALAAHAVRLGEISLEAPPQAIGTDTESALRSGLVLGHAGLVDGLVARMRVELGAAVPVIATGGLAAAVVPYCITQIRLEPWLTLEGLRLLWERRDGG